MKMYAIYNNVGRLLGHVEKDTTILRSQDILVMRDVPIQEYAYGGEVTMEEMETEYYIIPRRRIRFRKGLQESEQYYLVIDHKLPGWFWYNLGTVEFKPEHFERIPY